MIDCAREVLGWEPRTSLTEGLTRTIDYFRGLADSEFDAPAATRSGASAGRGAR
jgi:UDP-glucuronate decarboxylase